MRQLLLSFVIFCCLGGFLLITPTVVNADPPAPPITPTPGGGGCDLQQLKDSINQTESSGKGCDFKGTGVSERWGLARGKYQFIEDTWNRMAKGCPNASQCPHAQIAYKAECCVTQECAMDNLLLSNKKLAENSAACQKILGTTIQSKKEGSCTVTMAGILAAMHLGGADACDGPASGGFGDSDGHTTESDYICRHGNNPVPGNCQPNYQSDPSQSPPIGTLQQIEIQEAQGETIVVGSANGLIENWVAGLMLMAKQLTANMTYQVQLIGELLDAKHQLETQRLFQEKLSEAHKDYQVSEQMCTFGTFAKDLMITSRNADLATAAISQEIFQREIGAGESRGASGTSDSLSRIAQFRKKFCNPSDSANGLKLLCPAATPADMRNADIDFTRTIDQPLSLAIDPTDASVTKDEEAIFALVDNLFAHQPLPRISDNSLLQRKFQYHYANLRSLIAMRGIARNSIANIIALKTATPNDESTGASSAPYLRALFREFGLPDDEIKKLLGDHPSYNAQMEVLTKKIYQSPAFYTNLYDKPANVKRLRAAMRAIKLMQDRDIQASLHRREMLLSMMLEIRLRQNAENVYSAANAAWFESQ